MFNNKTENKNNLVIAAFIFIVAGILRFYNYESIPFTHDEYSALIRTHFSSFSELINNGVMVDGHPAGVQVFLYYWTKIFGENPSMTKLPFTVLSMGGLIYFYRFVRIWSGVSAALFSTSFLASIQYTVTYSQIARPYAMGFFTIIAMAYYWSKIVSPTSRAKTLDYLLYFLFASLSAYIHYFSFLMAFIIGLSGFVFLKHLDLRKYILTNLLVICSYLPHLKIFFAQLQLRGVEAWLGKPEMDFLMHYFSYVLQYSPLAILLFSVLCMVAIFQIFSGKSEMKYAWLFVGWFVISFVIGYLYSRHISAVLQYSVLIFAFPFLILGVFNWIPNLKPRHNLLISCAILVLNTILLIQHRKHYDIFYSSIYRDIANDLHTQADSTVFLIHAPQKIINYETAQWVEKNEMHFLDTMSHLTFETLMRRVEKQNQHIYLADAGGLDLSKLSKIYHLLPGLYFRKDYHNGSIYKFKNSKTNADKSDFKNALRAQNSIQNSNFLWKDIEPSRITSIENGKTLGYKFLSNNEWGPKFTTEIDSVSNNRNEYLLINVNFHGISYHNADEIILVCEIRNKEDIVFYANTKLHADILSEPMNTAALSLGVRIPQNGLGRGNIVSMYLWNKSHSEFIVEDFTFKILERNPFLYGLSSPIQ